jgi:hypothetical protein
MCLLKYRFIAIVVLISVLYGFSPAQEAADPENQHALNLAVAEIGVGTGYDRETRLLEGEASIFPAGTPQLWCRTRITGAETPTTITHVWYHRDKTVARVDLHIGSKDWRTVSSKNLLPDWTGPWEVKILDEAGTLLESIRFTVE